MLVQKTLSKQTVRSIIEDLEKAQAAVLAKHGLEMVKRAGRFSTESLKVTHEFKLAGGKSLKESKCEKAAAIYLGDKLGKQFFYDGKTYTIVGYNTRAKKSPVMLKSSDGKTCKCPMDFIERRVK
jgi:hypothetical protein